MGRSGGLSGDLEGILGSVMNAVFFIIGFVAVAVIVYGGVQYVMAAGEAAKIAKAKSAILWAVVGLVVCIAAYAVVRFVIANTA